MCPDFWLEICFYILRMLLCLSKLVFPVFALLQIFQPLLNNNRGLLWQILTWLNLVAASLQITTTICSFRQCRQLYRICWILSYACCRKYQLFEDKPIIGPFPIWKFCSICSPKELLEPMKRSTLRYIYGAQCCQDAKLVYCPMLEKYIVSFTRSFTDDSGSTRWWKWSCTRVKILNSISGEKSHKTLY